MSREVPESIKSNVKALLSSKAGGILMSEFLSDYCNLCFEPLKFRDLGFSSLQNFIKSIPDVARMMTTQDSAVKIIRVGESNTFRSLIPKDIHGCLPQNYTRPSIEKFSKKNGVPSLPTSASTLDDCEHMKPDFKGLWSVCLPFHLCPANNSQELTAIFSQAGEVKQTRFTETRVFVRYASKEEALVAIKLFHDLQVSFANNHKVTKPIKQIEDINGITSDEGRSCLSVFETHPRNAATNNRLHPDINSSLDDRNTRVETGLPLLEQIFGRFNKEKKLNGHHSGQEIQKANRESKPHSVSSDTDSEDPRKIELYVANIESEDSFRQMIKSYNPVSITVRRSKKGNMFAYVKVSTEDKAKQIILDLHNKLQKKKKLFVNFKKDFARNDSNSISGESSSGHSPAARSETMETHKICHLQADFRDMPPLIHESELGPYGDGHHFDCSILVENFHDNILESELRSAFAKYNVLDFCMVNNGSGPGCTKAILYLRSVYDVIDAVKEMNGSCVLDKCLKVDVPDDNTILKAVVKKVIPKYSASAPSNSPRGSIYSKRPY